ncbi:unnamed protein product [Closterium sp. NIES-53]
MNLDVSSEPCVSSPVARASSSSVNFWHTCGFTASTSTTTSICFSRAAAPAATTTAAAAAAAAASGSLSSTLDAVFGQSSSESVRCSEGGKQD